MPANNVARPRERRFRLRGQRIHFFNGWAGHRGQYRQRQRMKWLQRIRRIGKERSLV